ncbi:formyltransferase family protein [Lichenihabitans psoromatis]|uniref:formyltransferase family protein n=1 Tax=Lichenihabitans psoromatis TaxID=2528642 RepID=UPI0010363398|nr:formyltransferase family protein [Lichenihabitans psoromatis]
MSPPRLALFVLEALPNARAVRQFLVDHAAEIAFVGLSNAERPKAGGLFGQIGRHVRRSGLSILPYLIVNFGLPDLSNALFPLLGRFAPKPIPVSGTPLRTLCERHGIPVMRVDDVNGVEVADAFAAHRPDLIVSFHFDQIFSAATLTLAPLGGVNVHPSLLPRHRGPVPTVHSLAEDPQAFGVTVHRLVADIDAGAILEQEAATLPAGTSASGASVLLHERGRKLLDHVLATIARDGMPPGRLVPRLPYCPFPDAALLRSLRRRGRRVTDAHDLSDALRLNGFSPREDMRSPSRGA